MARRQQVSSTYLPVGSWTREIDRGVTHRLEGVIDDLGEVRPMGLAKRQIPVAIEDYSQDRKRSRRLGEAKCDLEEMRVVISAIGCRQLTSRFLESVT